MTIGSVKMMWYRLSVKGTQLLEKASQKWDYSRCEDSFGDENLVKIKGDLLWKDQKANDSITISVDDLKFTYKGKEQLKDNKRTFTRTFKFTDGYSEPSLIWKGSATHESDSMKANHEFSIK